MSNKIDRILAEISAGELFDKITILEIKKAKISNKEKLIDINRELSSLNETVKKFIPDQVSISKYITELKDLDKKDIHDPDESIRNHFNYPFQILDLKQS